MREILFRGKRKDNGEWIYGDLLHDRFLFTDENICVIYNVDSKLTHRENIVIPKTVGQYTGLTDKNGTKIFEGDICRFREWNKGDMCWVGKVHYEHQQFVISGNPNKECESEFLLVMSRFIPENIEVIGNVHDNPELLGGGEE